MNTLPSTIHASSNSRIPSTHTNDVKVFASGIKLYIDAIISIATPYGTSSANASAYYSDEYSDNNPVFIVKGEYPVGSFFEEKINAKNVDPRNASFVEMLALQAYVDVTKKNATGEVFVRERVHTPTPDYFSKLDYYAFLKEHMELKYVDNKIKHGLKNLYDCFQDHISKNIASNLAHKNLADYYLDLKGL